MLGRCQEHCGLSDDCADEQRGEGAGEEGREEVGSQGEAILWEMRSL